MNLPRKAASFTPLIALFATTALAQTAPGASASAPPVSGASSDAAAPQRAPQTQPASTSTNTLSEIVVTAQQRGENLQKAAVAVDVVKGSDVVASGVTNIDTLDKLVPALTIENTSNGDLTFIRGVGNFAVQANADPAIAFNEDGVYIARPTSEAGVFYDLQRIEVLKGPQGTLYGRNATGGAINVIPVQPLLDGRFSGYETTSFGNYGTVTTEGALNIPVADGAALRISGDYIRHDGYLADGTSSDNSGGVRVQFKDKLTSDVTLRLYTDYAHQGGTGIGDNYVGTYKLNPVTKQYVVTPSSIDPSQGVLTAESQALRETTPAGTLGRNLGPLGPYPFQDNSFYGAHAALDWSTRLGTFTVLPAWFHGDKHNLADTGFAFGDTDHSDQYTIEARLVSNPGKIIDYNLGLYYFDETISDHQSASAFSLATFTNAGYSTKSPAGYGRLTWHVTDRLRLVGGLRYTQDHKAFNSQSQSVLAICALPTGCPNAPLLPYTTTFAQQPYIPAKSGGVLPIGGGALAARTDTETADKLSTSRVTYRAAVEYDVAPRSLAYGSYETGYRSGGFNTAVGLETYNPETIDAYTLGLKNRFFSNRLQLNLEAFDWQYNHQQLSFLGVDATGRPSVQTQNVGKSTIKGIEGEGQVLITPHTILSGDVQYLHARYDSFVYQAASLTGVPLTGCAVSPGATSAVYEVNCSGKPNFNSPTWTINAGLQHTQPIGDYDLVLSINTQFRTGRYTDSDYIAAEYVGSTTQTDAQLSFSPHGQSWAVAVFVHNLEDDRFEEYAAPVPDAKLIASFNNPPRTYGVRLSGKF